MKKIGSIALCSFLVILIVTQCIFAESVTFENEIRSDYSKASERELTVFSGEVLCSKKGDSITKRFNITKSGNYNLTIEYDSATEVDGELYYSLKIDGEYPFETASKLKFDRFYTDDGDIRTDGIGNEFSAEQKEIKTKTQIRINNPAETLEPYEFYFDTGEHTVTVTSENLPFHIYNISLCTAGKTENYKTVSEKYQYEEYKGNAILIEGESAILKTTSDLGAKSDSTTPNVYPSDAFYQKINYIGGSNWSDEGDTIFWDVDIPEDGLYELSLYYRQNFILNGNSYRSLKIDGVTPFKEADSIAFPYNSGWKLKKLSDSKDNNYLFSLNKGKHRVSLTVTLGPLYNFCSNLENTVYDIGTLYRQIVMITGETPDANRDYNLFEQIPDFEKRLTDIRNSLQDLSDEYERISQNRGGSTVSTIKAMDSAVSSMLKYKYKAQRYKTIYYSDYSSLSAALYDMMNMPLDIDTIVFSRPGTKAVKGNKSIFSKLTYSFERFIASFIVDYNNISDINDDNKKITIWVNWGRDQAKILNSLSQSDFTDKTGINVDVKITNATLVQGVLSGNTPDCVLQHTRSEVVNLAMREALYDISKFKDYEEVIKRFSKNAMTPYVYKDGVYGLPDTQSFMMMFVRTDIFKEMGLTVPKTWDEFLDTLKILSSNNLETGIAGIYQSLLLQNGGNLYNENLDGTDLLSDASVSAFECYTDYFNKYDCPVSYNFYNRFRTGLMPLGLQDYSMYATLKATAPEINNKWKMFEIPGKVCEDGSIDNSTNGAGTACMILKDTGNEKDSWEFLKWWTSTETQVSYDRSLEGILGVAGRIAVSNIEAAGKLSWDEGNFQNLSTQWNSVKEFNEVPGSYYMPRILEQAYWNVINLKENPRNMLYKWGSVADNEIKRKIRQYENDK